MAFSPLCALSTELLLQIFKHLGIKDLSSLKQTCRRFNNIIETWGHGFIDNSELLVTNQIDSVIADRSFYLLPLFERLRISRNWKSGIYNEKSLLYSKIKYIPWIQLDKSMLWVSRGSSIQGYNRNESGINTKQLPYTIRGKRKSEICRFVIKDNYIFSGQTDGSLWLWLINENTFICNEDNCHEADVNSVDISGNLLVSGSRDASVKVWKKPEDRLVNCFSQEVQCINFKDRVWAVSFSENQSCLAVGTAGISHISTLSVFDLDRNTDVIKFHNDRFGAGILDITWESPSVLWSCGYEACLRRWDLRSGHCEQVLEDPCESVMYCFQYDHFNTILSGTQNNGRVVLWDTRQKNYIQMYFMDCCKRRAKSSPVYSLSFDPEFLFTATDQHVSVLNFSVYNGKFRDYSNLFLKLIKV